MLKYLVMVERIEVGNVKDIMSRPIFLLPSLLLLPAQVVRRIDISMLEMSLNLPAQIFGQLVSL